MPRQEEHEKVQNLVETGPDEEKLAARNLEDEVDSNATLQGYAAMNRADASEETVQEAYREGEREDLKRKAKEQGR